MINNKTKIKNIKAREILDCLGNPTIEVEIMLNSDLITRAIAPAGTSKGDHEALELRDGDINWYAGKGVSKAVNIVNEKLSKILKNKNVLNQFEIDNLIIDIDSTSNKSKLGGNTIIAISLCVLKAASKALNMPTYQYIKNYLNNNKALKLSIPCLHLFGGGIHVGNDIDIQEFELCPICAKTYRDAFHIVWKIFRTAQKILKAEKNYCEVYSLCGGMAPYFDSNEEVLEIMIRAIEESGYQPGKDIILYLDVAATNFFSEEKYYLKKANKVLKSMEMAEYLNNLINKYPIFAVEDAMAQDDWDGWKLFEAKVKKDLLIVGDDLFATNPNRLKEGISKNLCNAIIIKPNQIGTITETMEAIRIAKIAGYKTIISARSGESEDPILTHLAVGFGIDYGKFGGILGAESTARLNELIRIEENLNHKEG